MASAVTVLGAGSWGTALALHLGRLGHSVRLWARDPELVAILTSSGENTTYLPGARLPDTVRPTAGLETALERSEAVAFVCPSSGVRGLAEAVRPLLAERAVVVSAAKGVEQEARMTMTAILDD